MARKGMKGTLTDVWSKEQVNDVEDHLASDYILTSCVTGYHGVSVGPIIIQPNARCKRC